LIRRHIVKDSAADFLPFEFFGRLETVQTGDQPITAILVGAHDDGLQQALIGHGLGEGIDFVGSERP
jgi:hypothetical protein